MAEFAHADFWVVVGTAGPVLLLGNIVAAGQHIENGRTAHRRIQAIFAAAIPMVVNIAAFAVSLLCLASRKDLISTDAGYGLVTFGVIATFLQVGWAAITKPRSTYGD